MTFPLISWNSTLHSSLRSTIHISPYVPYSLRTLPGVVELFKLLFTPRSIPSHSEMTRMYYFMLHLSSADTLTAATTLLSELAWTFTAPSFYGGAFVCKAVKASVQKFVLSKQSRNFPPFLGRPDGWSLPQLLCVGHDLCGPVPGDLLPAY